VTWDTAAIPETMSMVLVDGLGGASISEVDMSSTGSLVISEDRNFISSLRIEANTDDTPLVISSYALYPNVPNPFNPATSIAFDLPRDSRVKLTIFDLTGRLVCTLANSTMPAGRHSLIWDGCDVQGKRVSSGVYFYRLQAEDFSRVRKMMILK